MAPMVSGVQIFSRLFCSPGRLTMKVKCRKGKRRPEIAAGGRYCETVFVVTSKWNGVEWL